MCSARISFSIYCYLDFIVKICIFTVRLHFLLFPIPNYRICPLATFKFIPVKTKFSRLCLGLQFRLEFFKLLKAIKIKSRHKTLTFLLRGKASISCLLPLMFTGLRFSKTLGHTRIFILNFI